MERNPIVSDTQVEGAVNALVEVAAGGAGVSPEVRVRAAETLLGHAWVYEAPAVGPAPDADEEIV